MSNQGYACFVARPRRLEELRCPHPLEQESAYEVVKTIRLPKIDYENFVTDMLADRRFFVDNAALCRKTGCVLRCLRVTCRGTDDSVFVVPDGACAALAALPSCGLAFGP